MQRTVKSRLIATKSELYRERDVDQRGTYSFMGSPDPPLNKEKLAVRSTFLEKTLPNLTRKSHSPAAGVARNVCPVSG